MNNIKRLTPSYDNNMCEDLDGDYVEFSCFNKLAEENKMLRETLELADSWLKTDAEYWGSPVCETIIKALEKLK
jgi:hypothetical protein